MKIQHSMYYSQGADDRGVDFVRDDPYRMDISLILSRSPFSSASRQSFCACNFVTSGKKSLWMIFSKLCQKQTRKATTKLFVLSDQQFKTERCPIYNYIKTEKSFKSLQLRSCCQKNVRIYIFCLEIYLIRYSLIKIVDFYVSVD